MKIKYDFRDEGEIELGYVKGCPLCGKTDRLTITPKDTFDRLIAESGSACISLDCNRCNWSLTEHDYRGDDYGVKAGILVTKWNTRKESSDGN